MKVLKMLYNQNLEEVTILHLTSLLYSINMLDIIALYPQTINTSPENNILPSFFPMEDGIATSHA